MTTLFCFSFWLGGLRDLEIDSDMCMLITFFFTTVFSYSDFSHGKFQLFSPGKASCDSHATQPMVHAGCFSVTLIHWTLTWTTGSLTCTKMLMHATALRGVHTHAIRESALEVDSWTEKSPLPYWGIKPASATCWSDALPIELRPHPLILITNLLAQQPQPFRIHTCLQIHGISIFCTNICFNTADWNIQQTWEQEQPTQPIHNI